MQVLWGSLSPYLGFVGNTCKFSIMTTSCRSLGLIANLPTQQNEKEGSWPNLGMTQFWPHCFTIELACPFQVLGYSNNALYWSMQLFFFWKVVGSEVIDEEDQGSQITQFIEGYREGRTEAKRINGPSFMGYINSLIGIRTVYIIVFLVCVFMLIRSINKEEPLRVGTREEADHANSSSSENEGKEYRPGDKEDWASEFSVGTFGSSDYSNEDFANLRLFSSHAR